jgi:hypothetical protein
MRRTFWGDQHPDTLRAQANLALSYSSAGRAREAIELLRVAIAAADSLDFEHPFAASWSAALARLSAADGS